MAKRKRTKKSASKQLSDEDAAKKAQVEEVIKNLNDEVENEIRSLEDAAKAVDSSITTEMRSVLMSIPSDISKMSVQQYIEKYLAETKAQTKIDSSVIDNGVLRDETNKANTAAAPPRIAGHDAFLKTPMPSRSQYNFRVDRGTPMITSTCVRKTSGKPRTAKESDAIGTIELNLFSERGSPMLLAGNHMSAEMRKKVAEALHDFMT